MKVSIHIKEDNGSIRECSRNCLLFFMIVISCTINSQTSGIEFDSIPLNNQLFARSGSTASFNIKGKVDRSEITYNTLRVLIKKTEDGFTDDYYEEDQCINGEGDFNFTIVIEAILASYSIEMYFLDLDNCIVGGETGDSDSTPFQIVLPSGAGSNIVGGDVYIIQGQSNAEAKKRMGSSNGNVSNFIRVYANGTELESKLTANDEWYIGEGDGDRETDGNTGQWGLKLANLLLAKGYPVAIFNGSRGAKGINYFRKGYNQTKPANSTNNNYQRLYYRLSKTGLEKDVRAVFWSQGENTTKATNLGAYAGEFEALMNEWYGDYPNIEHIYIFQTRTGDCYGQGSIPYERLMYVKEDQRTLALDPALDVSIMSTDGLTMHSDNCHFAYSGGYESFADRIYPLVLRDLFGESIDQDDNAPDILEAKMLTETKLIIQTTATNLFDGNSPAHSYYELSGAGSAVIEDLKIVGNTIELTLSEFPGMNARISNTGAPIGSSDNLVLNSKGIEILAFFEVPIDANYPTETTWNGVVWDPLDPYSGTDAIIDEDFNNVSSFECRDLTINTGVNFVIGDNNSVNTVTVGRDLNISGSMIIKDQGSLIMLEEDAQIDGVITKEERSSQRSNIHDITYWSSSVENATIENVFVGVNPNRIFYYDQSQSAAIDPDNDATNTYWNVWQIPQASSIMIGGEGYASEGLNDGRHVVLFNGKPNNGTIKYRLKGNFNDNIIDNDFNLVGNPYPSAIDLDLFLDENKDVIDGGVYLWTHATEISDGGDFVSSDYAKYSLMGGVNPNGPIPEKNFGSGQGFFIRAKDELNGNNDVVFKNNIRLSEENDQFYKSEKSKIERVYNKKREMRIWLNLRTDNGGRDQILIGFKKGLSDFPDPAYDLAKISGSNPISFYSISEENKYVIQGMDEFAEIKRLDLGFNLLSAPRTLTIEYDHGEGDLASSELILFDKKMLIHHDLSLTSYSFQEDEIGAFNDRFSLIIRKKSDLDIVSTIDPDLKIYATQEGDIGVIASVEMESLTIYNHNNSLHSRIKPFSKTSLVKGFPFNSGEMVFVSVVFTNGETLRRKFLLIEN